MRTLAVIIWLVLLAMASMSSHSHSAELVQPPAIDLRR